MRVHPFRGSRMAALWAVFVALALLVPASMLLAGVAAFLSNEDARSAPARAAEDLPAGQPDAEAGSPDSLVPDAPAGQAAAPEALRDPCQEPPEPPAPGSFRFAFRAPLPAAPLWNPPGPKRAGLQAGHWLNEERPAELFRLQHGTSGGGRHEWEVNLEIARRAARYLEAAGVEVDILPTTIPPRYRAHVFVAIHADGDPTGQARGFKITRPGFSSIPDIDDRLVEALYTAYEVATGLPRDDANITSRMRFYYAFNSRRYCHAVAPGVPQAIVETGFLTNARDRRLLLGNPDAAARGIAEGILAFLRQSGPGT
jgi:hypothetical protein